MAGKNKNSPTDNVIAMQSSKPKNRKQPGGLAPTGYYSLNSTQQNSFLNRSVHTHINQRIAFNY